MNIYARRKKETIYVLHNNAEEMRANGELLQAEGWSANVRMSHTESIREEDIPDFKEKYPEVEVQYPQKGSFLHSQPYVYATQHEREVKE